MIVPVDRLSANGTIAGTIGEAFERRALGLMATLRFTHLPDAGSNCRTIWVALAAGVAEAEISTTTKSSGDTGLRNEMQRFQPINRDDIPTSDLPIPPSALLRRQPISAVYRTKLAALQSLIERVVSTLLPARELCAYTPCRGIRDP